MFRQTNLRIICLVVVVATTMAGIQEQAFADYRKLLDKGATRGEVRALYEEYRARFIQRSGSGAELKRQLAGGTDAADASEFWHSFMLACLSNGWTVRAVDVDFELLPPAGAWAFSQQNFRGLVRQYPADCKNSDCFDIASLGKFEVKSIKVGSNVTAQLFTEAGFAGTKTTLVGSRRRLGTPIRSIKIRTPPRIDYVTVSAYTNQKNTSSMNLHISGANIDEGATVRIDGQDHDAEIQTRLDNSAWLGLGTDDAEAGYNLDPTYFAYPILHYDSIVTRLDDVQCDRTIVISVVNPNGQRSNDLNYTIPTPENLDSDGDGLLDRWETEGVDGLNLPAMGANPNRKDAYVEVDRMIVPHRIWSDFSEIDYPQQSIFEDARKLFASAPILNPDGSSGIALHIDSGQARFENSGQGRGGTTIPWKRYIGFRDRDYINPEEYWDAFQLRANDHFFDANRRRVFRYCIFADQQWNSRSTGGGDKSTFFLSLGVCRMRAIDPNYQLALFVHELGHTFGLSHAGRKGGKNSKPNFNSLMNYTFTVIGRDLDGKLGPFAGAIQGDYSFSYSEGMRAELNEAELREVMGVANHYPRDWSGDQRLNRQPVCHDVRNNTPDPEKPLKLCDIADWAQLDFTIK